MPKESSLQRIKPYLRNFKPEMGMLVFAIMMSMLAGVLNGGGVPALAKYMIEHIFNNEAQLGFAYLLPFASIVIIYSIARSLTAFLGTHLMTRCGIYALERLRISIFSKLQLLPLRYFHQRSTGDLITRTMNDTGVLQNSMVVFAQDIVRQPFTLMGAVAYLLWRSLENTDVFFFLIFIAAVPLCIALIRYVGKNVQKRVGQMQTEVGKLTQQISQNIDGIAEVRAFNREQQQIKSFTSVSNEFSRFNIKVSKYSEILSPVIDIIAAVGIAISFFYAGYSGLTSDEFLALLLALYLCYEPIKKLGKLNTRVRQGIAAIDRIEEVLHEPETIQDPAEPVTIGKLQGRFSFENVSFAYGEEPVLRQINLELEPGKTYALVGPSGAGKSTFCNLIPRFFDVTDGAIKIDGIDIRQMTMHDLRENIALVPQSPVTFADTVRNNLLVGKPDATDEEIKNAVRSAYAEEFIQELDEGFDTQLGEGGTRLSGGQRQRLAVARAFLKNAPILILDEATSALDTASEHLIQLALEKLMAGKTVFIIAHRFSSIKHADHILVFDQGHIIEQGSHDDLLAADGLYAALARQQATS